jgi:hypothetical protein
VSAPPRPGAGHVAHVGTLSVAAPLQQAFGFFTPEGERAWVPGWDPEYLHPTDGALVPGLVFRTAAHGEQTLWMVIACDPTAGTAEYARITPDSRLGTVSVRCGEAGPRSTTVEVRYRLTAVSARGDAVLSAFDAAAFATMLREWERSIAQRLATP